MAYETKRFQSCPRFVKVILVLGAVVVVWKCFKDLTAGSYAPPVMVTDAKKDVSRCGVLTFATSKGHLLLKPGLLLPTLSRSFACSYATHDPPAMFEWDAGNTTLTIRHGDPSIRDGEEQLFKSVTTFDWISTSRNVLVDSLLIGSNYVYGGGEAGLQYWPAGAGTWKMGPFVTHDTMGPGWPQYGNVLQRFWIFSGGFALSVDPACPLSVGLNESGSGQLMLQAKAEGTIFENLQPPGTPLELKYRVWTAKEGDSLVEFWAKLAGKLWRRPVQTLADTIVNLPIWSTWAQYKADIDSAKLMDFVDDIQSRQLACGMISLDDRWSSRHGDLEFDSLKFPNMSAVLHNLRRQNVELSLWVHPFVNWESKTGQSEQNRQFYVAQRNTAEPASIDWWNGRAHVIDLTNEKARRWFHTRLSQFRDTTGFASYKFDAGEIGTFFPESFRLTQDGDLSFSANYVQLASQFGSMTEVRTGDGSQGLGLMTRLADKLSIWGSDRGLGSIIPAALTLGLIGYPFVLPDMIGGNAYEGVQADKELYIRWLQAVLLFPAIQFSLPPWSYDQETVDITRRMLQLRQKFAPYIRQLANETTVTGMPIVRPIWFVEESAPAFRTCSEYLLGDRFLVAPVLEPSKGSKLTVNREVRLPGGSSWRRVDENGNGDFVPRGSGEVYRGPVTETFEVDLKSLLIFERLDD